MADTLNSDQQRFVLLYLQNTLLFARRFAKRKGLHRHVKDLEGAAVLGLCKAALKFDSRAHTGFETYARHRILGEILDHCRKQMPIGYRAVTRRSASMPKTGVLKNCHTVATRSSPVGIEYDSYDAVIGMTKRLGMRRAAVVRAYYLHGKSMRAIAADLGVNEHRVSQIVSAALKDLKD